MRYCAVNVFNAMIIKFHFLLPAVLPEHPVVLNRWGRPLNGTILGPKEEVQQTRMKIP